MRTPLIGTLFDGPIDVVGDVHGEIGALVSLLDLLGYDGEGNHIEGRRLVFLGDLGDRGPSSVAVVRLVRRLIKQGKAQAVVGNHELNLLRGDRKRGNHWFWGETEIMRKDGKALSFQALADPAFRSAALEFFGSLPLALERDDLVVVHAAWHAPSVAALRRRDRHNASGVAKACAVYEKRAARRLARRRAALSGGALSDDEVAQEEQNGNPVRVLTSGLETSTAVPFYAGGRMRTLERFRWWNNYSAPDGRFIVIGHYWRRWMQEVDSRVPAGFEPSGPDLFTDAAPTALLGPRRKVFCVDYAAGVRFEERALKLPPGALGTHLAALRLPERTVHREDGRVFGVS